MPGLDHDCHDVLLTPTRYQVNEWCHEIAYRSMSEEQVKNMSGSAKFAVNLGSGLTAGVAAAILSQVR